MAELFRALLPSVPRAGTQLPGPSWKTHGLWLPHIWEIHPSISLLPESQGEHDQESGGIKSRKKDSGFALRNPLRVPGSKRLPVGLYNHSPQNVSLRTPLPMENPLPLGDREWWGPVQGLAVRTRLPPPHWVTAVARASPTGLHTGPSLVRFLPGQGKVPRRKARIAQHGTFWEPSQAHRTSVTVV